MSKARDVRRRLSHPVVDADGHWLEVQPVFREYLREFAGPKMADRYWNERAQSLGHDWYRLSPQERQRQRLRRQPWWAQPAGTSERAAAMAPMLFRERMDDWGIDVALLYPTLGFNLQRWPADEMRDVLVRALNVMTADLFRPCADRMIPAATISMRTPKEAIAQIEHAHSLGLKLMMMDGTMPRPLEADADQPAAKRRIWLDGLGIDSAYDYDPVWKRCQELRMAVTSHIGSVGWPDRNSPTNFVANHLGHFAQSHHLFARSLFMGGVTERFPGVNFGFLEGGVGWACTLYADLMGHWEKRNLKYMLEYQKPTLIDRGAMRQLLARHTAGNRHFQACLDDIVERNLDLVEPGMGIEELTERDLSSDDFARLRVSGKADIARLFARNFYFGCEADDPMTAVAFDKKLGLNLKPVLGSDISHFDVVDPEEVLEEAWEMVEHRLIDEQDFRAFTFDNVVELHGTMNPDFFKGTRVEKDARQALEGRLAA